MSGEALEQYLRTAMGDAAYEASERQTSPRFEVFDPDRDGTSERACSRCGTTFTANGTVQLCSNECRAANNAEAHERSNAKKKRQRNASTTISTTRLAALETVASVARRAVDAIDGATWAEAYPIVAELDAALGNLEEAP
jgi:hypothetical protein